MDVENHYRDVATHALGGFQLIEEGLKIYIDAYHTTVRSLLPPELTYRHSKSDIQHAALGRLVNAFSKINSNDILIEQLRKLVDTRDELAHRAFVQLYGTPPPPTELMSRASAFTDVMETIGGLLLTLHAESAKIMDLHAKTQRNSAED